MPNAALVDHQIQALFDAGKIRDVLSSSIQPASIDLSMGDTIWQVAGVPSTGGKGGFKIQEFIDAFCLNSFTVTNNSATLNPGSTYLAELEGSYFLPKALYGYANPKSSIGRIDLHCIIITENGRSFNVVPSGYKGKLYALLIPQSFPVRLKKSIPLAQLRIFQGKRLYLSEKQLTVEQGKHHLIKKATKDALTGNGAVLHLDLSCSPSNLVSQRSGKPIDLLDFKQDPRNYFREKRLNHGVLFLEPGEFVLATTIERVRVPNHLCAEMIAFVEEYGEIRTHYAGFFDPGFGFGKKGEITDSGVVCEIRNIGSAPLILMHGQPVCLLRYEQLADTPQNVYGSLKKPSHYQGQSGVQLGKFFTAWND
jgi:dCTP deaminase